LASFEVEWPLIQKNSHMAAAGVQDGDLVVAAMNGSGPQTFVPFASLERLQSRKAVQ
jgi:hypothetical protein